MTEPPRSVLCCPDKFRGSIDARAAAAALAEGVEQGGARAVRLPLADGGEGTLETVLEATGGRMLDRHAPDALGRTRPVHLGVLEGRTAIVEMAQAVGLAALRKSDRDVMQASSAGVGAMIKDALALGVDRVVVTIGGTATMDGGLGALRELGARLFDRSGRELRGSGADLIRVAEIDTSGLQLEPGRLEIVLDAWCPMHGAGGSAATFGPQKGADPDEVRDLDRAFAALADLLQLPQTERSRLGTGGGFAAPFVALAGARVGSGAEFVRRVTRFDRALDGAGLCVTGEGSVDRQSGLGKTTRGVVEASRRRSIPTVVVAGAVEDESTCLYDSGATAVLPIGRRPRDWSEARSQTADDLRWIGRGIGQLFRTLSRAGRSDEGWEPGPRATGPGSRSRQPSYLA